MDHKRLIQTFDSVLNGKEIDINSEDTLEYHKNIRFARIAAVHYKVALLLRCQKLYKRIMSDNYYVNDLRNSDQLILPLKDPKTPSLGFHFSLD